jgi:predicted esterase
VVSNGRLDPMASAEQTRTLVGQLQGLGARVSELPFDGGHTIDPAQLPRIAEVIGAH